MKSNIFIRNIKEYASNIPLGAKNLFLVFPAFITLGEWTYSSVFVIFLFLFLIKDIILFGNDSFLIKPLFPIFFLLFWGVISIFLSQVITTGIAHYVGTIFTPLLLFLIIQNIDLEINFLKRFFDLLILSGSFISLISISIFIQSGFDSTLRIVSVWGDINIMSAYLMIALMLNLSFLINIKNNDKRIIYLISILIIISGIILSQTRGVWMGTVFALIVYFIRRPKVLVPVLIVITSFVYLFYDTIAIRFLTVKNYKSDGSSLGRLQAWFGTIYMLKNNFFIGNGFNAFMYLRDNVIALYLVAVTHSHNTYLRSLLEIGFIGSVVYYYFFFYAGYLSIKMHNSPVSHLYKLFTDGLELSFLGLIVTFFFEPYFSIFGNSTLIIWTLIAFAFKINTLVKTNNNIKAIVN